MASSPSAQSGATVPNIYRCTPRQTRAFVLRVMQAGLVPFVQSSPGMGKSSIIRSIARELAAQLIDHRVSTSAPEDFTGLPEFYTTATGQRLARFIPFGDLFPLEGTPIPEGKNGWILFLDESNHGTKMVQAAMYKLILDRQVGQFNLHPNLALAMAGNLTTDRAMVNDLSTAMQSRVVHIEMEINHTEWLEDVALVQNYDERVVAFLNWKSGYLMDFKPDHNEKTFCCPRTWEFINSLVTGQEIKDEDTALYAGSITSGVAVEFVQFAQIYKTLITIQEILANPTTADVPRDSERKWAITSHLMEKTTNKNFGDICTYMGRFDLAFRVLFFRGLLVKQPALRSHPMFATAMAEVSRYLNGTAQTPLPNPQP